MMAGNNVQSQISKRLKELDSVIYLAEASLSEYVDALGEPWSFPPPEKRNAPSVEDAL